jgi:hypothetical protein
MVIRFAGRKHLVLICVRRTLFFGFMSRNVGTPKRGAASAVLKLLGFLALRRANSHICPQSIAHSRAIEPLSGPGKFRHPGGLDCELV